MTAHNPLSDTTNPPPNIIFIVVDELRFPTPTAFPQGIETSEQFFAAYMPNLYKLWQQGVKFTQYYTAASDCTPGRGTIMTGLYAQQTMALLTRANPGNAQAGTSPQPPLSPVFPTYGKLLRETGYDTPYIGKWHLSDFPTATTTLSAFDYLDSYGFQGLSLPDPVGFAGQGSGATPSTPGSVGSIQPMNDAAISTQAVSWLQNRANSGNTKPFCLTVGFINPHDKQFFWGGIEVNRFNEMYNELGETPFLGFTTQVVAQANPPQYGYAAVPSNWESEQSLSSHQHPRLHYVFQQFFQYCVGGITDDASVQDFSVAPTRIAKGKQKLVAPYAYWQKALDMYTQVMTAVDVQIGQVVENIPASLRDNTIVVFTSDHGEYAGAHGLQGKGGSVYQESYRIPLIVADFRPDTLRVTADEDIPREQIVSSVDLLPLLVTLGNSGNRDWMTGDYAQLYGQRLDLLAILGDAQAPGRDYAVYTCDELVPVAALNFEKAPEHIIGVVTKAGKLGVYSFWDAEAQTVTPLTKGQEIEYYDYLGGDRAELDNQPQAPGARELQDLLVNTILPNELQAPLPPAYQAAQQATLNGYWQYVKLADAIGAIQYTTLPAPTQPNLSPA